jgi:hypothetical protein
MADGKGHGCVHGGRQIREAGVPAEAGLSSLKRLTIRGGRSQRYLMFEDGFDEKPSSFALFAVHSQKTIKMLSPESEQ